jgi:hypothetical protein
MRTKYRYPIPEKVLTLTDVTKVFEPESSSIGPPAASRMLYFVLLFRQKSTNNN